MDNFQFSQLIFSILQLLILFAILVSLNESKPQKIEEKEEKILLKEGERVSFIPSKSFKERHEEAGSIDDLLDKK